MSVRSTCITLLAAILCLPATALAQHWSEDFDSYATGSGIIGQGGWGGWEGDASLDATVSDAVSRSAPNSLECGPGSDVVQEFDDVNTGPWIMTAWQYIPGNATGDSYFLLLNSYEADGMAGENWSTQLRFGNGVVESEFDGASLPLIVDRWVEIRVEIDFTGDNQMIFYDGALLTSKSWTEGVSGAGKPTLAALDIFGNGAAPVYYDDMELRREGSTPTAVKSWGEIKEEYRN